MNVNQSIWELNTGKRLVPIFEKKNCSLPAEKLQPMIANIHNSMEFEILKDGHSFYWIILNLPASINNEEKLEIVFKINNTESFEIIAKVPRTGENIQIIKKTNISDYYRELSRRWTYDDIYSILSIAHNASMDDIESAFANKRTIHRNNEEINDIITKAFNEVDSSDKRKKLYLQKIIINNLSKKHNFYNNESCKENIYINCIDRIKEDFFTLIKMQEEAIHRTILEIEKPAPIHIPGMDKKDHLGITKDEAEEGTNISLGVMSGEDQTEFKIGISPSSTDGLMPILGGGRRHECIHSLRGDATIKVKIVPIDANVIFEDIKKELKTGFKNSNKEDIIKAIREEVRRQYHTSNDIGVNERRIVNELVTNIRKNALPISLTGDETKEGKNISLKSKTDSISVKIPSDSKDCDMIHVKDLSFVEVKEIPANTNVIFEDINKKLKGTFNYSNRKDIIEAIRGEVHRQYHESGLKGIGVRNDAPEEKIAEKIMKNRGQYHRSGCAGVNEGKIINKIISMLPPPIRFDITLKEAIYGCQKRVTLLNQKCKMCGGTGFIYTKISKFGNNIFRNITTRKCICSREINVKVPPIKTLFLNHIIPIEDGRILVKSQLGL